MRWVLTLATHQHHLGLVARVPLPRVSDLSSLERNLAQGVIKASKVFPKCSLDQIHPAGV